MGVVALKFLALLKLIRVSKHIKDGRGDEAPKNSLETSFYYRLDSIRPHHKLMTYLKHGLKHMY